MYWWRHFDAAEVAQDFARIRAAGTRSRCDMVPLCGAMDVGFGQRERQHGFACSVVRRSA
jgi:hypothetical protein